jgi:fructose-1,6-bisphosphatase/inositol monophosphatase family enzyme
LTVDYRPMGDRRFLDRIRRVLSDAVVAGASQVLAVRGDASNVRRYKANDELVTLADERSDAAMSAVFAERLAKVAPGVGWHLEESGRKHSENAAAWVGADPLDGTHPFASGGTQYCVQAHYLERGVPLVGVILQPEIHLPLNGRAGAVGRLVWAIRGGGAFVQRSTWRRRSFTLGRSQAIAVRSRRPPRALTACVSIGVKMTPEERDRAIRLLSDPIVGATAGTGSAGGNILMAVFGGLDLYVNFGAGNELDVAPGQVIAQEAGLAIRTVGGRPPVWDRFKQPVVVAPIAALADRVLRIGGV